MKYRPEIDGLRAVAVVPVILFHAGFSAFSGGFVGVDVFFVISGYLISTIIISEKDAGTFSLARFYERRARRILPALFLVMLVSLPFAWLWLFPPDMKDFSASLVAVNAFSSNILFYLESGYFGTAAALKPLLHTWSLAVEEQYYVLFPLFLLIVWSFGKARIAYLLAAMALLSLVASQVFHQHRSFTFYLLPTRAWEILIGALVAFYLYSLKADGSAPRRVGQASAQLVAMLGIGLIAFAVFTFTSDTPSPGLYTLAPTLGTALVILFGHEGTLVGKLLSARPVVGLGLMSYSTYLWHQPLLAFARHRSLEEPSTVLLCALILAAFILAYLSWRFVEMPFRDRRRVPRNGLVAFVAVCTTLCVAFGAYGYATDGYQARMTAALTRISRPESGQLERCSQFNTKGGCLIGRANQKPNIAIIGDSHSEILQKALSSALDRRGLTAVAYAGSWCVPLIGIGTDDTYCRTFIEHAYDEILNDDSLKTVILAAEWATYTKGYRWGKGVVFYTDSETKEKSTDENVRVFRRGVSRTLASLEGHAKHVILVKSVPEYAVFLPLYVAKRGFYDKIVDLGDKIIDARQYSARNAEVESVFAAADVQRRTQVVSPFDLLCTPEPCRYLDDAGNLLYFDSNHLSDAGSEIVVAGILKALEGGK